MTTPGKRPAFLRDATGIVRGISPRSAFITTVIVTNLGFGGATMYSFVPFLWPGSNQPLALLLVLPFMIVHSAMYTLLAWAMPRAGGDYVWTGRILHPALGLSLNLTWVVYGSLFMGSYANYTITYGLYSIFLAFGIATRNYGLVDWSRAVFTSPFWIITFATIFLIYVSLIMIFGLRTHLKHQLVAWIVGMVGTIVALVLFLNTTPTQFAVAFDSLMGRY
jgi:amino acid transporter